MQAFGEGIWLVDGPQVVGAAGFHFPTRMVVVRLSAGLLIWSPVARNRQIAAAVDGLGPVAAILAPNHLHNGFLGEWAAAYPHAPLFGGPGLAAKRPDLPIAELGDEAPDTWHEEIDQVLFPNRIADELVLFHRASGTAIFCDLLQQMPAGWYRGWRALVARMDLMTGGEPQVPRKFRLATRKAPARLALERINRWPVKGVVMAHGMPVSQDASAFLKRAFLWLMR